VRVVASVPRGCGGAGANAETGYPFRPGAVGRLAGGLAAMRAGPELRAGLGRRARARAVAMFDERAYVARQVRAIDRLVGRHAAAVPATPPGFVLDTAASRP